MCLCVGNIYIFDLICKEKKIVLAGIKPSRRIQRIGHIHKSKQSLSGRFYFVMSVQLLHPQKI